MLSCAQARCTKLSTEVSEESEVFVSKQEKQMAREKREDVVSPQKGERNRIGMRVLTALATNKQKMCLQNMH